MEKLQCFTMGDIARLSTQDEDLIYKALGINAELLIDHAWGWEPTDIATIKTYKPDNNSISSGQVLMEPYDYEKGRLIIKEMTEVMVLDLVKKGLVTRQVGLTVSYDKDCIKPAIPGRSGKDDAYIVVKTGKEYTGNVTRDYYGRLHPEHAHGSERLDKYSSSTKKIMDAMMRIFDRVVDPDLTIRRVGVVAAGVIDEKDIPADEPEQLDLFTDYAAREKEQEAEKIAEEKERKLQKATLELQEKFGKNAVLKGMNLNEGATTIMRNGQIGGHKA
jgi:DNA polymerase V